MAEQTACIAVGTVSIVGFSWLLTRFAHTQTMPGTVDLHFAIARYIKTAHAIRDYLVFERFKIVFSQLTCQLIIRVLVNAPNDRKGKQQYLALETSHLAILALSHRERQNALLNPLQVDGQGSVRAAICFARSWSVLAPSGFVTLLFFTCRTSGNGIGLKIRCPIK
jgi:hypothetical protein